MMFRLVKSVEVGKGEKNAQTNTPLITAIIITLLALTQTQCTDIDKYFNTPPTNENIESTPTGNVPVSTNVTLTAKATDADGDTLTYSWNADAGKFNATDSKTVIWTAPDVPGTYTIKVVVTDGQGGKTDTSKSITVESNDLIVTNLRIQEGYETLTLTWENPSSTQFRFVRIMRNTVSFPAAPDDGEQVYQGIETFYTDKNLTNGTPYYYAAFVGYQNGNWGTKVDASGTPSNSGSTLVSELQLDKTTLSLETGNSQVLKVTVLPANADNRNVHWESVNTAVATVTDTGLVTALSSGQTVITVKADANPNIFVLCTVTVVDAIVPISRVVTQSLSSITTTTAISGGVISPNDATVSARGIAWGTAPGPILADAHTQEGTGGGSFTSQMTSLLPGTQYNVRAWATGPVSTVYGNELIFETGKNTIQKCQITGSFQYDNISVRYGNTDYEYPVWTGAGSGQTVSYSISPTGYGVNIDSASGKVSVSSSAPTMDRQFTVTAKGTVNCEGTIPGRIDVKVYSTDIRLRDASVSSTTVNVNEEFTFYCTLENISSYRATDIAITYYQSDNTTITDADTEVGDGGFLSRLDAGVIRSDGAEKIIAPSTPGTYYYGAIAVLQNYTEADTSNNKTQAVRVSVVEPSPPVYKTTKLKFQLIDAHEPDPDNIAEIYFIVKEWDSFGGRTLWSQGSSASPISLSEGDYIPYSAVWVDISPTETTNFWIRLSDADVFFTDTVSGSTERLTLTPGEHSVIFGGGTGPQGRFYYYVEEF